MTYTLRVSVRLLGQSPIIGIDQPVETQFDGIPAVLVMQHQHLIMRVSGFADQDEAERFLPRVKAGLWNIALVNNLAFVPEFRRCEITFADDPVQTGKNIAKSFDVQDAEPIHGLSEEGGYAIFRTDQNVKFMGIGSISVSQSWAFECVYPALLEGVAAADSSAVDDPKLVTAMALYLSQFFESSLKARLLTLTMVLEVLAPEMPKHRTAVQLLQQLTADIDSRLGCCRDEDEQFALESLKRELDFRKETSIRRRVRELVNTSSGLPADRKSIAREVVRAYDLRGQLVHTGAANEVEIYKAFDTVFDVVKAILRGKLGLKNQLK